MRHAILIPLVVVALAGCQSVALHGNQAVGGGTSATATSSAVVASRTTSNARVAFSSGQPVSPTAPGGHLAATGGGAVFAVLVVGAVVADFLNSFGGAGPSVKPLPPDTRISHTCSCYGYTPPEKVMSDK